MVTNLNETFAAVQAASRELAILDDTIINQILNAVADAAIAETPFILAENEKDLARMDKNDPKYDRLKLTEERLKDIVERDHTPQRNETDQNQRAFRSNRNHLRSTT